MSFGDELIARLIYQDFQLMASHVHVASSITAITLPQVSGKQYDMIADGY